MWAHLHLGNNSQRDEQGPQAWCNVTDSAANGGEIYKSFLPAFLCKEFIQKRRKETEKKEENPGIIQPLYLLGRCNPAKWNISVPYLLAIDELGIVDFIKVVIDPCPHYLLLAHRANTPGTAYHASCSRMKWTLQTSFPGGLEGMSRCSIPLFTLFSLPPFVWIHTPSGWQP